MRRRRTLIGAMMMHQGDADAHAVRHVRHAIATHLRYIEHVIGLRAGVQHARGDERC